MILLCMIVEVQKDILLAVQQRPRERECIETLARSLTATLVLYNQVVLFARRPIHWFCGAEFAVQA